MKKATWCLALTVVGSVLIVVSYFWRPLAGVRGEYGQQQAREYTQAAVELHQLQYGSHKDHDGPEHSDAAPPAEADPAELAAAKQRYEQQRQALETARSWRERPRAWLKWTGVAAALVGAVGYLAFRQQAPTD